MFILLPWLCQGSKEKGCPAFSLHMIYYNICFFQPYCTFTNPWMSFSAGTARLVILVALRCLGSGSSQGSGHVQITVSASFHAKTIEDIERAVKTAASGLQVSLLSSVP